MASISKNTTLLLACAAGLFSAFSAMAVTYDVALKDAMAKADARICDTIDESPCPLHPQFSLDGETGVSVKRLRESCRVKVVVAQGKIEGCLLLDNHFILGESMRHMCLADMARSLKRPDICTMAEEGRDSQAELQSSHDRCRMFAIADPKQCAEGFYDPEIRKRLQDHDECILTIAENTRNAALCGELGSWRRKNCEGMVGAMQSAYKNADNPQSLCVP